MTRRIQEFDIWRPGYANAKIYIYVAGTSTLANVFLDEALTMPADNPQTLKEMEAEGGTRYGKFERPLYIQQSYFLTVNGIENTGVVRPAISALDGEDASQAILIAQGSTHQVTLEDFAGREVNVANFGQFVEGTGGVAATNTATMNLAIAALADGGFVNVPSGLFKVNSFNVPENVIIRGQGIEATKLECINGSSAFNIVGKNAGFENITLDGNSLSTNSIGVESVGNDGVIFNSVLVKRFETGVNLLGGKSHNWIDLSVQNTENAVKLIGDLDAGGSTNGSALQDLVWTGGLISFATTRGIEFSYNDAVCQNITLIGVGYEDCDDIATYISGAQNIIHMGCWWSNNQGTVFIKDDTNVLTPVTERNNDALNIKFIGGRMNGGVFEATGTAQNVVLEDMNLTDVEFKMTIPIDNFVVLKDCFESSGVTITGELSKLIRKTTTFDGESFGLTTTGAQTKAWAMSLKPGQIVYLEAKVLAKGRNNQNRGIYHVGCGAYAPPAQLQYDTQITNFTAGAIVTGQSSGATGRVQQDADTGATGTLFLVDIVGEFLDNETIIDDNATPGEAKANGVLFNNNAVIDTVGTQALRTVFETAAAMNVGFFAVNPNEVELRVTGIAGNTIEWTVNVEVVST